VNSFRFLQCSVLSCKIDLQFCFVCFSDDGFYRSFDGPSLVPSPDVNNLSPEERNAMQEEWRVELARVELT